MMLCLMCSFSKHSDFYLDLMQEQLLRESRAIDSLSYELLLNKAKFMFAIKNICEKNTSVFTLVYKQGCFYALLIPSLISVTVIVNILLLCLKQFYCIKQEYAKFVLQYTGICHVFIAI